MFARANRSRLKREQASAVRCVNKGVFLCVRTRASVDETVSTTTTPETVLRRVCV